MKRRKWPFVLGVLLLIVDGLTVPFGAAFQAKVIMVLTSELGFSPARFQDGLRDNR